MNSGNESRGAAGRSSRSHGAGGCFVRETAAFPEAFMPLMKRYSGLYEMVVFEKV